MVGLGGWSSHERDCCLIELAPKGFLSPSHQSSHQFSSSKKMQIGSQLYWNLDLELPASRPGNHCPLLMNQLSMVLHFGKLRRLRRGWMNVSCTLTPLPSVQGEGERYASWFTCVWVHITVIRHTGSEGKLCRLAWVWILASIWTNHVALSKLFTLVSSTEKGSRW